MMRFIIKESKLKDIVLKYLNKIDWVVKHSSNDEYPVVVFEHSSDDEPTFVIQCVTHRYGESYNLLISSSFQERLEKMFGRKTVGSGPNEEPNTLIMDWFNEHINDIEVDDYLYMHSGYIPY